MLYGILDQRTCLFPSVCSSKYLGERNYLSAGLLRTKDPSRFRIGFQPFTMNILKMGCLQNFGSVLEVFSLWKCSRGFVALTGTKHDYTRKIIGIKAPANSTQSQCRLVKLGFPPNSVGMRSSLRFRKVAFIRRGDSLEEVACFEERLFVRRDTCYSAFSLSPNCSSGVGNQREEETAGGVQTMKKAEEVNRVDNAQDLFLKEVEQALGSPLGTQPQAPSQKPLVLVISGPSGVGKDAVINRLQEVRQEIHFVVTATTRAKRSGEVHGKDYFFLTKEQFESMIQKNELLEHAIVYGDYKGIPKGQVRECLAKGFDVVLRVDVQGAATVRSILGSTAVFIFLVAESEAALVRRLIERKTETTDKLLLRIATAREEVKRMDEFDYVVVNADRQIEKCVSLICCIIDSEKARVQQREAHL